MSAFDARWSENKYLDAFWKEVLDIAEIVPLLKSPFLFTLIASVATVSAGVVFTFVDLYTQRVPLRLIIDTAKPIFGGFIPFLIMYYTGVNIISISLPEKAPSIAEFGIQLFVSILSGDFLHYLAHRTLHAVPYFRHNIHSVHHAYEGPLFCWIGVQVHPLEVAMINTAIYAPFFIVAHPLVLWFYSIAATVNAVIAHSGYDGGWFALGNILPFGCTSNDHQLHHDVNSTKNYGNVLALWDHIFGTYGTNVKYPVTTFWKELSQKHSSPNLKNA